jgi:hypothetical protein
MDCAQGLALIPVRLFDFEDIKPLRAAVYRSRVPVPRLGARTAASSPATRFKSKSGVAGHHLRLPCWLPHDSSLESNTTQRFPEVSGVSRESPKVAGPVRPNRDRLEPIKNAF